MTRENLKEVLIRRDGVSKEVAEEMIQEAADLVNGYLDEGDIEGAANVCQEMFGLEPDYIDDVMDFMELPV